jgi:hypothetical protein
VLAWSCSLVKEEGSPRNTGVNAATTWANLARPFVPIVTTAFPAPVTSFFGRPFHWLFAHFLNNVQKSCLYSLSVSNPFEAREKGRADRRKDLQIYETGGK